MPKQHKRLVGLSLEDFVYGTQLKTVLPVAFADFHTRDLQCAKLAYDLFAVPYLHMHGDNLNTRWDFPNLIGEHLGGQVYRSIRDSPHPVGEGHLQKHSPEVWDFRCYLPQPRGRAGVASKDHGGRAVPNNVSERRNRVKDGYGRHSQVAYGNLYFGVKYLQSQEGGHFFR